MSCIITIIFNIFVNPITLEAIGWKYYIIYVVLLVVYGTIVFSFYPETRGFTLEQIAFVFGDVHIEGQSVFTVEKIDKTTVEEKE